MDADKPGTFAGRASCLRAAAEAIRRAPVRWALVTTGTGRRRAPGARRRVEAKLAGESPHGPAGEPRPVPAGGNQSFMNASWRSRTGREIVLLVSYYSTRDCRLMAVRKRCRYRRPALSTDVRQSCRDHLADTRGVVRCRRTIRRAVYPVAALRAVIPRSYRGVLHIHDEATRLHLR